MKPSAEMPEPSADTPPLITADLVEPQAPRRWWRSRYARWTAIALVLLTALGIALEPLFREQAKEVMGDVAAARAISFFYDGDLPAALAQLDKAVEWAPENPAILFSRAEMRRRNNDLEGSLADYNRVIELRPTFSGGYAGRATVWQRLGKYPEAIGDLTLALRHQPAWEPDPWNQRAYIRALGNVDLELALDDVNEAIRLAEEENASYLDTRGYIQHLLGKHSEALADLNRAILLTSAQREQWRLQGEKEQSDPRLRKLRDQDFEHALAVMYQHRGRVHAALKNEADAARDAAEAQKLGYDPAQGIE
ncbi:MAG: hypothetical protein JNG90_09705 [Planctomycetaceae bacterium]|nr:hypothetical protein [Planctomycetaceae bacterium]